MDMDARKKEKSQADGNSLIDNLTFNVRDLLEFSRILKEGARRERYTYDTHHGVRSRIGKVLKDTFK